MFMVGSYYKRSIDGPAYRCEAISQYRVLLFLCARLVDEIDDEKRLRISADDFSNWVPITSSSEFTHLEAIYNYNLKKEFSYHQRPQDGLPQRQYHIDRYLDFVSPQDKKQRYREAVNNLIFTECDGSKIQLEASSGALTFLEVLGHLDEDALIQGYPADFYKEENRVYTAIGPYLSNRYSSIDDIVQYLPKPNSDCLIKYAKAEFAQKLFEEGKIRISLATHFRKQEHNDAIRDSDEDSIVVRISKDARPVKIVDRETVRLRTDEHEGIFALKLHAKYPSYIFCLSKLLDARHFFDFDCDAYVSIPNKNIETFAHRINEGAKKVLNNNPLLAGSDVVYYDPLRVCDDLSDVFGEEFLVERYKDFKYAYQREYRFIWPVKDTEGKLPDYLDIECGPMNDIAELVVFDS